MASPSQEGRQDRLTEEIVDATQQVAVDAFNKGHRAGLKWGVTFGVVGTLFACSVAALVWNHVTKVERATTETLRSELVIKALNSPPVNDDSTHK